MRRRNGGRQGREHSGLRSPNFHIALSEGNISTVTTPTAQYLFSACPTQVAACSSSPEDHPDDWDPVYMYIYILLGVKAIAPLKNTTSWLRIS